MAMTNAEGVLATVEKLGHAILYRLVCTWLHTCPSKAMSTLLVEPPRFRITLDVQGERVQGAW